MNYLEALEKRYAVKKFNGEKIPDQKLENILKAGRLSASSLGLQPYQVFVIRSQEKLNSLIPAFFNPSQISTCSDLIVICSKSTIEEQYLDNYFEHITKERETPKESLTGFRNSIESFIKSSPLDSQKHWIEHQAYILLGSLLFASAMEQIDSCPMEGFNKQKLGELLNLDPSELSPTVCITLGYRSEEDHFQHLKKVRKPNEKLFKYF